MAKEELWLPTTNDFLLDEATAENRRINEPESSDEDDSIAGLSWRISRSSLHEQGIVNQKAMASSPESTLCGLGSWSFSSSSCSPDEGPSQVSSPPSTPFWPKRSDALDLLSAAAGRVVGLGLSEDHHPPLFHQQLHAAPFQQQQLAVAWRSRCASARSGSGGRTMDISPSTWSPVQKPRHHHPKPGGSGMTAVFLSGSGTRRGSAGTGVFLPRTIGETPAHSKKKPACSTVLLPARVVQVLNLNLDEIGVHSAVAGDQDYYAGRTKMLQQQQKRSNVASQQPGSASGGGGNHEIQLPQEWTY